MASYGGLSVDDITYVNGTGVRVRDAAVNGETLYTIANNNKVKVRKKMACSDGYCWYRISNLSNTSKPDGWIRGDFLKNSSGSWNGDDGT